MRHAFTLIEMLVATVLITLLVGVALFSMRMQLLSIQKIRKEAIADAITYTQIRSVLVSMRRYIVRRYDIGGTPLNEWHEFFHGDAQQATFITADPLLNKESALVRLRCENHHLLYEEEPLYGPMDDLRPAFDENHTRRILYRDLEKCRFA